MSSGKIQWIDLTVDDAKTDAVRDFYEAVAGWSPEPIEMGGYADYIMQDTQGGGAVAGICRRRAGNSHLPPQWMIYISVPDVDGSAELCTEHGGKVLHGPVKTEDGERRYVIQDPAGAVATIVGDVSESEE